MDKHYFTIDASKFASQQIPGYTPNLMGDGRTPPFRGMQCITAYVYGWCMDPNPVNFCLVSVVWIESFELYSFADAREAQQFEDKLRTQLYLFK